MAERKPHNQTWESFAEQQIRAAEEAGAFSKLPGLGKPIPGIDAPLEENWWVKQKLQSERMTVPAPLVQARLDIERTRQEIADLKTEEIVRGKLEALRKRVLEAITSPLPSPPVVVLPIDVNEELRRWRDARKNLRQAEQGT